MVQLSILGFLGLNLHGDSWHCGFNSIDWGNEVNSNDVYMMLLALLVPDSTNMGHWINHWLSETVVVCFEVKVITTLLVPGLGMAWRSSPIWVSLGVVAGWDQTSRSCLNKFHTTSIASSILIAYQDFPHIQQSVSFVFSPYLYIFWYLFKGERCWGFVNANTNGGYCTFIGLGSSFDAMFHISTPRKAHLLIHWWLSQPNFQAPLHSSIVQVFCPTVGEATHRVTLALLAPWILQAKMRNIWKNILRLARTRGLVVCSCFFE